MIIEIDHDVTPDGHVTAVQFIDTNDPAVIATLQACSGNAVAQAKAQYAVVSKHSLANPLETRWAFLLRQINAPLGPANLKALNLV